MHPPQPSLTASASRHPTTDAHLLPYLPISRIDGRWHLTFGLGQVLIDDDAVTRDLEALSTLLAPATSPGRRP
ncbi:hypothetical protein [Peterkaempfera bronchialis]|uniref:hypothetical protein n=1 Tax=Peterkaempfera bronchialis TaxID=2126346 RepID=UPI003C2AD182